MTRSDAATSEPESASSFPRATNSAGSTGTAEEQERRIAAARCGFTGDVTTARQMLHDEAPKVRSAALAALARNGGADAADVLLAIGDVSPIVRRTACELAVSLPRVDRARLLDDDDTTVVESCAFALGELGDVTAVSKLIELAGTHADALCRESAVAALGALGDPRGKEALLEALRDSPQIRRRAVVALANFEGSDVDGALRVHLTDRDWQVRQAAEDVLGVNVTERS